MRGLSYLMTFFMTVLLAACGGGGGSPGLSSGSGSVFSVTAPAALTLRVGLSQQYAIKGGVKPYSVISTDPAVAIGWFGADDFVSVGAVVPGTATLTVLDAKGSKFDMVVTSTSTSGPIIPFFTTTPTNLTLAPGAQGIYTVGGGTAPYTVTSANPAAVNASLVGTNLTLGGLLATSSPVSVAIRDAVGATASISVTVGASVTLSTSAPSAVTIAPGAATAQTYTVSGGVAPYTATSNNVGVAAVALAGSSFTVTGVQVSATPAVITIRDAAGATVNTSVTVGVAVPLATNAPAAVTIAPGAGAAQTYTVSGGVAPYSATSNNVGVATATLTGSSFTITGVQVSATPAAITIRDASGATVPISVTVAVAAAAPLSVSPSSVTAFINDTLLVRISGGTPPYRVDAGVTDALTATIANQSEVTVRLLRAMAGYSFIVLDANNQTATVSITASVGTNVFRLSPASVTIAENETQTVLLTVYGASAGTPRVFSSNTGLLTAVVSGSTVTLSRVAYALGTSAAAPGSCVTADTTVTITLIDATGAIGTSDIKMLNSVTNGGTCFPP